MPCTEAYREHIMYSFNGYCKTVIRFAAINAWRDRGRRRQKEISLEYLTEEKFYPLGTTDEYFEAPYEGYPITICGQTVSSPTGSLPPHETIVRATSGEPEAVDGVLRHYSKRIRIAAIENGHIGRDTEDSIKSRLVAALFKFRFDEQPYTKTE